MSQTIKSGLLRDYQVLTDEASKLISKHRVLVFRARNGQGESRELFRGYPALALPLHSDKCPA